MDDLRIQVPGGELAVRDYPGPGRTVVLVHSVGYSSDVWRRFAPLLAARHRVLAIDLRGHGQSTAQVDTVDELVADFERLIQTLDLRCPVILGHQYGGGIAAAVVARYPLLWGGLCVLDSPVIGTQAEYAELLDTFASPTVRAELNKRFRFGASGPDRASMEAFIDLFANKMNDDWLSVPRVGVDDYQVQRTLLVDPRTGEWVRQPTQETIGRLTRLGAEFPLMPGRELLEHLLSPVWVVQPEAGDYGFGYEDAAAMAAERLGWAVTKVPGRSFMPHTHPEVLANTMFALLERLPTQREPEGRRYREGVRIIAGENVRTNR